MSTWLDLENKHILMVGAGGFGTAISRELVAHKSKVTVADIDRVKLDKLEYQEALMTFECDVSSDPECRDLVSNAIEARGPVDVLIHAVGINNRVPIEEIDATDLDRMFHVNTASCLYLARAVVPTMRTQGCGRIIFISSVSGHLAHPHHGSYAASKGALNQLMKVMAVEWAPDHISVNAIAPGYALTPLTESYCATPGNTNKLLSRIPAGRLAAAEDVAGLALFLASRHADYMTGQVIYVDGGRTLD